MLQRNSESAGPENSSWTTDFHSIPSLEELAAQQGVSPITSIDSLVDDFWPEKESVDEFITAVRQWRREGSQGSPSG
ncbi:MAG: hypothetical protein HYU64_03210 [Armatimonadetes bacterium]|nr:hypothetical protein [Armatimonadota bacterium]